MRHSDYFKHAKNRLAYPALQQRDYSWRDILAKTALFLFSIAFWYKGLNFQAYAFAHYFLLLAWILDGGLSRLKEIIKEPFVASILILCIVIALGILWSDDPKLGFRAWRRYSAFLVFIPYLALLNKGRLPWAVGGLLIGYFVVLTIGIYQRLILGAQGIPPLGMPYLHFSSMLGIGFLLSLYLAGILKENIKKLLLASFSVFLLFIQFSQDARGILIATIISSILLIFLLFKKEIGKLLVVMALLLFVGGTFVYNSTSLQGRIALAKDNIESFKAGDYNTSLGHRLALWDIGLHGIAEQPLFGHGTGMGPNYFNKSTQTYKGGLYKDLPKLSHYHNDWIEIGMYVGALGLIAYIYFLKGWFQTLRSHQLSIPGAVLLCFIFLCGITDLLVFFRQTIYLLLVVTAIGISWQRTYRNDPMTTTKEEK
jgi:O-antigen ligase